jgi:5-oxoprolinase (ATP-hydrolysing) subunit A
MFCEASASRWEDPETRQGGVVAGWSPPPPRLALVSVSQRTIDLNADLGEVSACGGWATTRRCFGWSPAPHRTRVPRRDPAGLARTCRAAAAQGVRIGAQVGYRDLAGFGRRYINVAAEDLTADVIYQIGALQALAHSAGSTVSYVKPHGALYNTVVTNEDQACAVAAAVRAVDPALPVLGLAGSAMFESAADSGFALCGRGFREPGLSSRRTTGVASRRRCDHRRPGCGSAAGGVVDRPRRGGRDRRLGDTDHRGIDMRARRFAGSSPNCGGRSAATDRGRRRIEAIYIDQWALA